MCADDVVGYEVVLADGHIVSATATRNSDLFKALEGGQNNLGIVTRFEIKTFASHDVYGDVMAFLWTQKEAVVGEFIEMVESNSETRAETGFVSLTWSPVLPCPNVAFITANVDGVDNSTTFAGLKDLTSLVDYRAEMPITGLAAQLAGTLGIYNIWYTLNFHNTMDMGRNVVEVFDALVVELQGQSDKPIQLIFVFTPFPRSTVTRVPATSSDSTSWRATPLSCSPRSSCRLRHTRLCSRRCSGRPLPPLRHTPRARVSTRNGHTSTIRTRSRTPGVLRSCQKLALDSGCEEV